MKKLGKIENNFMNNPQSNFSLDPEILEIVHKVRAAKEELSELLFVEREQELHGLFLALTAKLNIFFYGPPGVGKTLMVTALIEYIKESIYYEYTLDSFTVPEQIAGHVSLKKLKEDILERNIENTICDAHLIFLDEFWKANNGIINFLLPLLNERKYYNGNKVFNAPALVIIGASNEIPEEADHLDAAYDRFVLKYDVKTIQERANWIKMMQRSLRKMPSPTVRISLSELNLLQEAVKEVTISDAILHKIMEIKTALEKSNILVSPRVINNSLKVLQAEALLAGRSSVDEEDLVVLAHTFWKEPEHMQIIYKEVLKRTSPDNEKLNSLKSSLTELYNKYQEDSTNSTANDALSMIQVSFLSQAKSLKEEIRKLRKNVSEKNRSTSVIDGLLDRCNSHLEEVAASLSGANIR